MKSQDLSELNITLGQQIASSSGGAMLVSLFMTPLDVVKIRLQAQDMVLGKKCFLYSNGISDHLFPRVNGDPPPMALHSKEEICNCKWYNRPKYFNGTFDAMLKIGRVEGVTSLWSGLSPTLVLAVPTTVVYLSAYEGLKAPLSKLMAMEKLDNRVSLVSGAVSRGFAVSVVSPLELVRTKMQSKKMSFWQVREALSSTVKAQGVLGLWRGYSATLYRDVPFSALYWPFYEGIKNELFTKSELNTFTVTFVAGGIAGSIASAITLPMDVIKTRRQIEMGESGLLNGNGNGKGSSPSTLRTAREIVSQSGFRGLYTGLTPRLIKVAPACAIMISSYEYCKRNFAHYNAIHAKSKDAIN